jgi:hypothetical protein
VKGLDALREENFWTGSESISNLCKPRLSFHATFPVAPASSLSLHPSRLASKSIHAVTCLTLCRFNALP